MGFTAQKTLRIVRAIDRPRPQDTAQMVKLVDTPASGAGDRKVVEVRVFFWAPIQKNRANGSVFCFSGNDFFTPDVGDSNRSLD